MQTHYCMKARQDRGLPMENIRHEPIKQNTGVGSLTPDKGDPGRIPSSKTYALLVSKGALSQDQISQAFKMGRIKPAEFRKVFWAEVNLTKPTTAELGMMNQYHAILF